MAAWNITLSNRTRTKVDVMIFQTMPDALIYGSYFTAWKVEKIPDPGDIRLELPETFEFCVIDYLGEVERQTGPFPINYGDEIKISQPTAAKAPTVTMIFNENIPKDRIKVINLSGNAQPLEMALFKNDSKMVFYKDIVPNSFVYMAIKPSVYMAVVGPVKQGQEFLANSFVDEEILSKPCHIDQVVDYEEVDAYPVQAESNGTVHCLVNDLTAAATHFNEMVGYSVPVEFKTQEDRPVIKIQVTQKPSGEYVVSSEN
jgi:hypothetical protein